MPGNVETKKQWQVFYSQMSDGEERQQMTCKTKTKQNKKKNRQCGFRLTDWTGQHASLCQKTGQLDRKWTAEST